MKNGTNTTKNLLLRQLRPSVRPSLTYTRMEEFHQLMLMIGSPDEPDTDILKNLPIELSEMILSKLDPESLLNCALVSTKWLFIVKLSSKRKKQIREHICHQYSIRENNSSSQCVSITNSPKQPSGFLNPNKYLRGFFYKEAYKQTKMKCLRF